MAPRAPVSRIGDDRYALRLDAQERKILGALLDELRQAMRERDDASEDDAGAMTAWPGPAGDPDDPLARLYPPAFPDDEEAEAAWSELVRPGLDDARNRRLDRMAATIDADELDDAAAAAWLGTLNDLRLVLGSQLGISEDEPPQVGRAARSHSGKRCSTTSAGWSTGSSRRSTRGSRSRDAPDPGRAVGVPIRPR